MSAHNLKKPTQHCCRVALVHGLDAEDDILRVWQEEAWYPFLAIFACLSIHDFGNIDSALCNCTLQGLSYIASLRAARKEDVPIFLWVADKVNS